MTQEIWDEQSSLTKEYDADSVVIQKLKKSKFYTLLKEDFTLYYDVWAKEGHVTFSFFYRDLEIRTGRYASEEIAIPRLKKLWTVMVAKVSKDTQEVEEAKVSIKEQELI